MSGKEGLQPEDRDPTTQFISEEALNKFLAEGALAGSAQAEPGSSESAGGVEQPKIGDMSPRERVAAAAAKRGPDDAPPGWNIQDAAKESRKSRERLASGFYLPPVDEQ